jgi:hypothetical protein
VKLETVKAQQFHANKAYSGSVWEQGRCEEGAQVSETFRQGSKDAYIRLNT